MTNGQKEFFDQQKWLERHKDADEFIATKSGKVLAALYRSPEERLRQDYNNFVQMLQDWAQEIHP